MAALTSADSMTARCARAGRLGTAAACVSVLSGRLRIYLLVLELRALYSPYLQVPRTMRVDQSRRHRAKALGPCRALQGLAGPREARRRRPGLDRPMRDGRSQDCAARGVRGPRPAVDRPTTAEHAGGPGTPPVPRGPGSQASMVPPARPGTGAGAWAKCRATKCNGECASRGHSAADVTAPALREVIERLCVAPIGSLEARLSRRARLSCGDCSAGGGALRPEYMRPGLLHRLTKRSGAHLSQRLHQNWTGPAIVRGPSPSWAPPLPPCPPCTCDLLR